MISLASITGYNSFVNRKSLYLKIHINLQECLKKVTYKTNVFLLMSVRKPQLFNWFMTKVYDTVHAGLSYLSGAGDAALGAWGGEGGCRWNLVTGMAFRGHSALVTWQRECMCVPGMGKTVQMWPPRRPS